jgi:hypothetical protein
MESCDHPLDPPQVKHNGSFCVYHSAQYTYSIETKAENNRLKAKQYPAIQRNTATDCGTRSKTPNYGGSEGTRLQIITVANKHHTTNKN